MSPKQLTALSVSVLHTDRVELGVFLISDNWCFQKEKKKITLLPGCDPLIPIAFFHVLTVFLNKNKLSKGTT